MDKQRREMMLTLALAALGGFPGAGALLAAPLAGDRAGRKPFVPASGPRVRVVFVNDLSGDADGLFAGVHALLSPSIDLRAIIGTTTGSPEETTAASVSLAQELLRLTGRTGRIPIYAGAEGKLTAAGQPVRSAGTQAIIDEAMRGDTSMPLYVAVGGGLTEVASALMLEPSIASRLTVIWIGGVVSPDAAEPEYNFRIDPLAARFVFNDASVPIWQIPREAYSTCLVSITELRAHVAPRGKIGKWLYDKMLAANAKFAGMRVNTGETWTLGDNPLVLLAALADWVPSQFGQQPRYERTGSSIFHEQLAPFLDQRGRPQPREHGRKIRIYQTVDVRMMLADFYSKLHVQGDKKRIVVR